MSRMVDSGDYSSRMPSEIRIWRRREPRLFHAIAAVLLAQTVVCLVFWCTSAWRLHVRTLSLVHSRGAASPTLPQPLPRPMSALVLILLPSVAWMVALAKTRRLTPEDQQLLERWGDLDDEEEWASAIPASATLAGEAAIPRRPPGQAREATPGAFIEDPAAACAGSARGGVPTFQRFIATWSPPLWPHRPRARQPPGGSCDPPAPPDPSPASCLPQCETARR